jgi:photosystem II stability/assembly factor-like uncharacterized protein
MSLLSRSAKAACALTLFLSPLSAQRLNEALLNDLQFRNLGPWRTGAWVTDFAVPASPAREHRYTFYVATRNGGLWKTQNGGTTFEPVFDATGQHSIGAVAVAPSDPNTVWAGTGESYVARYSYSGDGVYKSTDGGRTWQNMGLRDSHHIVRIAIHPTNPNIVYVASMGHLHTPNSERGVFRTIDGGRTWTKVLFVDDKVGVIDLVMAPSQPDVLYAATYDKVRYPWHLEAGGPGSGIYKSTNGGTNWTRLTGGLPTGKIGRIGIDVYPRNPSIVYAIVENINPQPGAGNVRVAGGRGEVYRSDDGGANWRMTHEPRINVGGKAPYSFNMLRVDPSNEQRVYVTGESLMHTADGGKTWLDIDYGGRTLFRRMFGDVRTLWIDPEDSQRILVGSDGGVNVTYDGGRTVDNLNNLAIGEIYALAADNEDPYNIYVGLQDHESWRAPINGFAGTVGVENWVTVGTGDGMYQAVDPVDSRWAYNTLQFGGHVRVDQQLGTLTNIAPRRPQGQPRFRYTWTTPVVLSPHDSKIVYTGAQVVLMSPDRGTTWTEISPDLTTNDTTKQNGSGNIQFTTITTLAESPRQRGVIWVGADDGSVRLTRDGGKSWSDPLPRLLAAGAPAGYWVSRVVPSRHQDGTAFVTITGFHRDDFKPYVFRTDDFGATWRSLGATLPARASANVIGEDPQAPGLLFLGTDHGLFASYDGGARWTRFRANLPTVPVRDLMVHPRESDLIVGTHGRGIFITDITPLREVSEEVLAKEAHLFAIEPKSWRVESGWGNYRLFGDRNLSTPNEPNGVSIAYYQRDAAAGTATIRITNASGAEVRVLTQPAGTGIRRALWNLRNTANQQVEPGDYTVTLRIGGSQQSQVARVKPPVVLPRGFGRD